MNQDPGLSRDSPAPGLVVYQPARGYRYALDPILLVGWALLGGRPDAALDVGTGSGVMALLLARQGIPTLGLDVRPEWIALARRSAAESDDGAGGPLPVRFECSDIRIWNGSPAPLALCNPPYLPLGRGRLPPDPLRAAARHELAGALSELVPALARAGERIAMVLPQGRAAEAEALLGEAGRPLVRATTLGPLALLEGRAGGGEPRREQHPLQENGTWSAAVCAAYAAAGARLSRPG